MNKKLSFLLALLMLASSVTACAESKDNNADTPETTGGVVSRAAAAPESETEEETENPYYDGYVDPFADTDLNGETLSIYTSVDQRGTLTSSNILIEGPEEITGDLAPDAAYQRNLDVMDMLNVDIQFAQASYSYDQVANHIKTIIMAGDSGYDVIVNDIYGLAPLVPDGLFHNVNKAANFDFDNPWWYNDFMSDLEMVSGKRYILAGDFFIDMLRCSHCLIMNKDMYGDLYGDPEDVYAAVLNKEWTMDYMTNLLEGAYIDLNGNSKKDDADQFGFTVFERWGGSIPWIVSADPGFIERNEDGTPEITVNNERSILLVEKLATIFNNDASSMNMFSNDEVKTENVFFEGRSLFLGYQRLGSLENANFRDTDIEFAVLPYPMLDENSDGYVTSTHDTAELGFIPSSTPVDRLGFISTVVEVLCRETYTQVLPTYYESSLKVKYSRDQSSAQMLDIIHDNFDNGFALAYSNGLSGIFLLTISDATDPSSAGFATLAKTKGKVAQKLLDKRVEQVNELE